jgi:diaminopimelate decarboxylase
MAGHLHVGGCDLVALAETHGTPLYLYDQATLDHAVSAYRDALAEQWPGEAEIAYAAKAWFNLAAGEWAAASGLGLDVVSLGEWEIARRAGFPLERVHLHGNNKPRALLHAAIVGGVGSVVVDHEAELATVEEVAAAAGRRQAVWLRLNPAVAADTHHHIETGSARSKFGLSLGDGTALRVARAALASPHIELVGLHAHIGSQIADTAPLVAAIRTLLAFAAELHSATGWAPRDLSPGGGWAVPYMSGDPHLAPAEAIAAISRALLEGCQQYSLPLPRLVLEPGRELVARAGVALYRVGALKEAADVHYAFIDGGLADNPRPALYDAHYTALLGNRDAPPATTYTLAGPFCESGDILIHETPLPMLQPGDLLAVPASGAYQLSMANNYNAAPRPAVLWLQEGQATLIQRRETLDDLLSRDLPVFDDRRPTTDDR